MGLYLRAGLLVKFFGFLIISVLGLTLCTMPVVFAQDNNSNSASIKAPKNLKKSANNKSDSTNKDEKSEKDKEKDKDKVPEKSSDNSSDIKDEKSDENKSNTTSNGTPFGAWIPRDRVLWEHPDSANNAGNIKQSSNASKPKVVPVEKAKTSRIDPIRKTNSVKSSASTAANKSKSTRTPSKLNKSKSGSSVKTTRKFSGDQSSKTITTTKSQPEDLITQEEPIDSSITESEGGNLPEDKTNIGNVDKNQQPLEKSESNGENSNQISSTIVPESTQTNENVISEPPTENFDSSTLDGSKDNSKVESTTEPGIDESTALEDDASGNNSKIDSNKITSSNLKDILKAIGYLLIVLALITFLWWISKYLLGYRDGAGFSQKTKLLHQMDLGMNQKLKLVQSGNMVLVLGVSPTGVQLFDKFPIEELDSHDWSSAVTSKTGTAHEDIHISPSEAPRKPRVATKPNIEQTQTTLRNAAGAYSDAANAKGKSFTFRGGRLIERNEITDHTISQTPAQEKLISQIRSKVKQWDL